MRSPSGKIATVLLLLTSSVATVRFNQATDSPGTPKPVAEDELRREGDGTATATGIVLENVHGCQVDAACYLQLRVGSRKVRVIYHPGEGEIHINKAAYQQGIGVSKGAHVTARGRYSSKNTLDIIETFSSDTFYIHVLPH